MANVERRVARGRQKVQMVRMEKQSNRLVTFSKRRSGLFKKASELCTLCGAKAVVVVFSPGRKAFSFGHPSVDAIIHRFLTGSNPNQNRLGKRAKKPEEDPSLAQANMDLTLLNARIEATRKACEELIKERKANGTDRLWWLGSIDELVIDPAHVDELVRPLAELKEKVGVLAQRWINAGVDIKSMSFMDVGNVIDQLGLPSNPVSMASGGEGPSSTHGQPSLMVPDPIERNPNKQPPPIMIPTPMVGMPGPSDGMGSNGGSGLALDNPLPRIPPMNPMSNTIGGGFGAPNMPPFQRAANPIGGHLNHGPTMPPFNLGMMDPNPIGGHLNHGPTMSPFNIGMMDPRTTPPNYPSLTSFLMAMDPQNGASNNPQSENDASNNPFPHGGNTPPNNTIPQAQGVHGTLNDLVPHVGNNNTPQAQGVHGTLNNFFPHVGNTAPNNLVPQAQDWNGAPNNPLGVNGAPNISQGGFSPNISQGGFGYEPRFY